MMSNLRKAMNEKNGEVLKGVKRLLLFFNHATGVARERRLIGTRNV